MLVSTAYKAIFSFVKFLAPKTGETRELSFYKENQKLEPSLCRGPITNQSLLSEMKYGASDVGKTGCEAVAIYNILLLMGRPRSLSEIIFDLQRAGALVNQGKWGTNPYTVKRVLDYYGIKNERVDSPEEAEGMMGPEDFFFVTVWNNRRNPFKGIHGFIIRKEEDGGYSIYNRKYMNRPEKVHSFEETIRGYRFITGYLIKK